MARVGIAVVTLAVVISPFDAVGAEAAVERGKYLFDAGGCNACHTDPTGAREPLTGGPPIKTPFGTFYAPNITPDPEFGVGNWSEEDFLRAMREGVGPDGRHYYPAFPYTSYTQANETDLLAMWAYLKVQAPVARASQPHDVGFPFSLRPLLWFWKLFNFEAMEWRGNTTLSETLNRGSYLVNAISHCGECHTPRNFMGGLDRSRWLAGGWLEDGKSVAPNLTPDESGLADWTAGDIVFALQLGFTPDGDVFGGAMGEVVKSATSLMTSADLEAIAAYVQSLPARESAVERTRESQ